VRQEVIADGWFGENLPDGQFAVSKLGKVVTHLGEWPVPDEWLRFTRCFDSASVFKAAGQSQSGAGDLVFENGIRRVLGPSYGVSTVAFDLAGEPVQNKVEYGSQGIRWIDEAGIHTGDATYVHPTIPALWEYTTHGDITVGQGDSGAHLICPEGRFVLYPGYTVFIRFNRRGDKLAVSIVAPGQNVMLWFDRSEITQFPRFVEPAPTPPPPPPPPPPQPKPEPSPVSHPNNTATIEHIRAKYPTPLGATHPTFLIEVAQTLGVLLFKKDGGSHVTLPNGVNVSQDIVLYPDDHEGFDILGDAEGAATPGWSSKGTMVGEFVDVSGLSTGGSEPGPKPSPTPSPATTFGAAAAALELAIANLTRTVQEQGKTIAALAAKTPESHAISLDGVKIALRTDNGHFVSAQDGGGGVIHTQRPVPGEPVDGYQPGGWETFTVVAR
jgi:hypothetical protein